MKTSTKGGFFYLLLTLFINATAAVSLQEQASSLISGINITSALTPHSRVRRGHGSCVTGMGIDNAASSGDASKLNAEASGGGGRGRGKRSVDSEPMESKSVRVRVRSPAINPFTKVLDSILLSNRRKPKRQRPSRKFRKSKKPRSGGGWFATRTQALFNLINLNFQNAQDFQNSEAVQSSDYLRARIRINPKGVNCHDLCSPHGTRYALVGFCTPDYCQCFDEEVGWSREVPDSWEVSSENSGWGWPDKRGKEKERSCNKKYVFDPVTLKCSKPSHTILCSDKKHGWSEPVEIHSSGWTPSEPVEIKSSGWTRSEPVEVKSSGWTRSEPVEVKSSGWTRSEPVEVKSSGWTTNSREVKGWSEPVQTTKSSGWTAAAPATEEEAKPSSSGWTDWKK